MFSVIPEFVKIRIPLSEALRSPHPSVPVSCKLIHRLLSRRLICNLDNTLWTVFGSDPIKFGLEEFGTITGLNCGEFPNGHQVPDPNQTVANKQKNAHKDPFWRELIGKYNNITIADLADELENDKEMSEWRRIRLALIIIVDGVLIASQQVHRPTLKYVKMLDDVDAFLQFPWGRESFLFTIRCMKPPKFDKGKPVKDPVGLLVEKLKQETFRLTGFPLALQLLAFRTIPMLQSKIPAPIHELTIMDLSEPNLPSHPSVDLNEVLLVEENPDLVVTSTIPLVRGPQPGWGVWSDGQTDGKVSYMEQLIANKHCFDKAMWPGGDCSEPLYIPTPIPEEPVHVHKKHTVSRKRKQSEPNPKKSSLRKGSTKKKQRRTPAATDELLQAKVTELEANVIVLEGRVITLEATIEQIKEKLKRKRRRSRAGSSVFKFAAKNHRKRTLQTTEHTQTNQDDLTKDVSSEETEFPIVSQYRVHHHSSARSDPYNLESTLPNPVNPNPSSHNSPNFNSPNHNSPNFNSPNHNSPKLNSPNHNSTNHNSPNHNSTNHNSHNHSPPTSHAQNSADHKLPDHNSTNIYDSPHRSSPKHNSPELKTPVPSFEDPDSNPPHLLDHHTADFVLADHPTTVHTPTDHTSTAHETSAPKSPENYSTNLNSPHHRSHSQNSPPPTSPVNIPPHPPVPVVPTHTSPPHASLFLQASPSQLSPPIATFPQFDATPLDKQTSPNPSATIPQPDSQLSVPIATFPQFDATPLDKQTSASVSSPPPLTPLPAVTTTPPSSPNKSGCFSQGFSPHYLATNAFAATASRKGSPIINHPSERLLIDEDERNKDPDHELSDASADTKIKRVVDELQHMTVLMHMFGERHQDMLKMEKATFTPPSLISLMISKERQFQAAVKKDRFHWDTRLKQLILAPGKIWMRPVHRVYTPMIWGDKHWVGLCINLLQKHVIVFDPLPDLYNDDKALRFLKPILDMLPYLIHYVAKDTSHDLSPFTWERTPNIYQNLRSGDCGPVSAKFLEMHLYFDPHPHMSGITDHHVDKFRQLYAMEAYKTIVLPAYY
ncbi:hypothetical protein Bca4012_017589 [Brassica carinata]